jgi:hypothetical protein
VQASLSPPRLDVVKNVVKRAKPSVLFITLALFELLEPGVVIVFAP